jgi:PAS domain S-box-containing protein
MTDMQDVSKDISQWSRDQLIGEIDRLSKRVAELEAGATAQHARETTRASEDRLRQVIQSMPVMMLAYDETRSHIIVWNRECERVTGFSRDEIAYNSDSGSLLYPDEDYRRSLAQLWQETGDNYRNLEWLVTCKDGTIKTISWSNITSEFPITGWGTWAIGIDVTARKQAEAALQDAHNQLEERVRKRTQELALANSQLAAEITERKQIAEALQQSEVRLRRVLENMPGMLIAYDEDAESISMWNRECERVMGYSAEEIVGKPGREINSLLYVDAEHRRQTWQKMLAGGDNYRDTEWTWIAKDGTPKIISWSNISSEFPIAGWATWAIGIDITERQHTEDRALKLALEQERVNMLEQFISDASHDLKTPLASMQLSLAVLGRTSSADQRDKHLSILSIQVTRLKKIIDDLLNIIRLDHEKAISSRTIDVNEVIQGLVRELEPLVGQKQQHLHLSGDTEPLLVLANVNELNRAISNLMTNAMNYTAPGGSIYIRSYANLDNAIIEVEDTGIGISKEELPYIFDRFFRADQARNTNTGGMGLGLAIVRKIVETFDGSIDVESTQGKGTVFRVALPLSKNVDS